MNTVETLETSKAVNTLKQLQTLGQSIWLDYIRRNLITSGELQRLINEDGLRGMTSNPSIFEKAIAGSTDYADLLEQLHAFFHVDNAGHANSGAHKAAAVAVLSGQALDRIAHLANHVIAAKGDLHA